MATYSSYLGLKLNAGSDPFLLSDFTGNWGILDASPGVYICTSLTRPAWTAQQAGRTILMTDLEQMSYWTGTSWQDLRDSSPVFAGGSYLNASLSRNSTSNFSLLTYTCARPSALAIIANGVYQCDNRQNQDGWQNLTVDGTDLLTGGYREQIRFEGNSADSGGSPMGANATSIGVMASVTAGTHVLGIKVSVGTYPAPINLAGAKVMAFVALFNSGNSL
jgi:hypothetical protein